jgi:hypothetical protein
VEGVDRWCSPESATPTTSTRVCWNWDYLDCDLRTSVVLADLPLGGPLGSTARRTAHLTRLIWGFRSVRIIATFRIVLPQEHAGITCIYMHYHRR